MTTIIYKYIRIPFACDSPVILISNLEDKANQSFSIKISDTRFSYVVVNGNKYKLNSGEVKLRAEDITEGLCEVSFILGTAKIPASPFLFTDGKANRVPLDNENVGRIEKILISLAEKLSSAEERLLALEEKIKPKNMFNFN